MFTQEAVANGDGLMVGLHTHKLDAPACLTICLPPPTCTHIKQLDATYRQILSYGEFLNTAFRTV